MRKILENTFVAGVEHHAALGSTNDRAIEYASLPGAKLPFLVLADRQTAGRGRGANRWWTGAGSLAFSLLIGPEMAVAGACAGWASQPVLKDLAAGSRTSALVSLAAGVAVVEAVTPLLSGHEIGIHWPNDVMLDGRKLAGILIEILSDGKQVIGIGMNVNNTAVEAPEDVRPRVATLRDATGQACDATDLLIAMLCQLQRQLVELSVSPQRVAGRTHVLCLQRGKRLKILQGERQIEGRCLGIAADGALVLQIDGQQQAIYSGVVQP